MFLLFSKKKFVHKYQKIKDLIFFSQVADVLELIQCKGESAETPVPLDMDGLLPADRGYYTYQGSFTTPDYRYILNFITYWLIMIFLIMK